MKGCLYFPYMINRDKIIWNQSDGVSRGGGKSGLNNDSPGVFTGAVFTLLMLLASLNSCTNPWIYSAFSSSVSPELRLLLLCRTNTERRGSLPNDSTTTNTSSYWAAHTAVQFMRQAQKRICAMLKLPYFSFLSREDCFYVDLTNT